jgi:hypothetical protein
VQQAAAAGLAALAAGLPAVQLSAAFACQPCRPYQHCLPAAASAAAGCSELQHWLAHLPLLLLLLLMLQLAVVLLLLLPVVQLVVHLSS